jgi:sugar O-acyltransferase (sialic acid O-acetyltransferase NeuD family)
MEKIEKKIGIFGSGGFGREVLCCLIDSKKDTLFDIENQVCFLIDDEYYNSEKIMGVQSIPLSEFKPEEYDVVVAVGNPSLRKKIIENLPKQTTFKTIIHPRANVSKWVEIGEGSIITAGSTLTCNIKIGKHSHINLNTTIGHDCIIGDYFTTAPAANISGNCNFGECVYIGTNAAIREGINICNDVTVGMGAVVVKNITQEGVYIGNPLKKLK